MKTAMTPTKFEQLLVALATGLRTKLPHGTRDVLIDGRRYKAEHVAAQLEVWASNWKRVRDLTKERKAAVRARRADTPVARLTVMHVKSYLYNLLGEASPVL